MYAQWQICEGKQGEGPSQTLTLFLTWMFCFLLLGAILLLPATKLVATHSQLFIDDKLVS